MVPPQPFLSPTESPPEHRIGTLMAGTYMITDLIGRGGMSAVYIARHQRTGRQVAIKVLSRQMAQDAKMYRRFEAEARIASSLNHENIAHVTDFHIEPDGTPFLVMELFQGEDLQARLERPPKLTLAEVLHFGEQAASGLHAAHMHDVVHRDVKPHNIYLAHKETADGPVQVLKILDFGICKIRHASARMTQEKSMLGTPEYMAPEAALGRHEDLDGRADQFSLATILYTALSGTQPFLGTADESLMAILFRVINETPKDLDQVTPTVPHNVARAIARAMSKDRELRFPTMADFASALLGKSWAGVKADDATHAVVVPSVPLTPALTAPPDAKTALNAIVEESPLGTNAAEEAEPLANPSVESRPSDAYHLHTGVLPARSDHKRVIALFVVFGATMLAALFLTLLIGRSRMGASQIVPEPTKPAQMIQSLDQPPSEKLLPAQAPSPALLPTAAPPSGDSRPRVPSAKQQRHTARPVRKLQLVPGAI